MDKIRVFVALDHGLLRGALRQLISGQSDMEVVGESDSAAELFGKVTDSFPHIVLTDAMWAEPNSIALVGQIRQACPASRILLITMSSDIELIRRLLEEGASGCVGRHADDVEVLSAIRHLHQGQVFIDPELAACVVQNVLGYRCVVHGGHESAGTKQLSRRELQVLEYLLKGYTNQQIADHLFLSVKTTETYRARLKRKLGLRNRSDIVRYGMEMGLLGSHEQATATQAT